jgi:uroporphyrinogen-III synthase
MFTSPSTVRHFLRLLAVTGIDAQQFMRATTIVSIGPVTGAALRSAGFSANVEPAQFTASAMVEALARHFTS